MGDLSRHGGRAQPAFGDRLIGFEIPAWRSRSEWGTQVEKVSTRIPRARHALTPRLIFGFGNDWGARDS